MERTTENRPPTDVRGRGTSSNAAGVAIDSVHVSVPCNLCGAENRVPDGRVGERARCGRCRSALMSGAIAAVAASRLDRLLAHSDLAILVQVCGEGVPKERLLDGDLRELARTLCGSALVYRVDAHREPAVLDALGLSAVPSLALVMGGRVRSRVSGALDREALLEWLASQALDVLHG
ncbi:Thioredoxin-2 [Planctomycetes bacterium Pla163]|uniref:Thioredoxin-2 n=1 Tax=Rohdeia mirabilis TaxID=2528008 RepID=A0A518CWI7_9BACT|nr:Thioredoxin-2 [Planctomycetes bacterium Pla163]